MRQTGRTTRIVQYVVEQLYNVGTCVATDHAVYECEPTLKMLKHFEDMVRREVDLRSTGYNSVKTTYIKVDQIPYIKFELIRNK